MTETTSRPSPVEGAAMLNQGSVQVPLARHGASRVGRSRVYIPTANYVQLPYFCRVSSGVQKRSVPVRNPLSCVDLIKRSPSNSYLSHSKCHISLRNACYESHYDGRRNRKLEEERRGIVCLWRYPTRNREFTGTIVARDYPSAIRGNRKLTKLQWTSRLKMMVF